MGQNYQAVVAGASGLVGNHLLQILINHPEYSRIRLLVRTRLPIESDKIVQIETDFQNLENIETNIPAGAHVFCCLGTTIKKAGSQAAFYQIDFMYPAELARLSAYSNASKFLLISSIGADKKSKIFYNCVKGEVEDVVSKLRINTVFIFRPSLLLGKRKEVRIGERIGQILSPFINLFLWGSLSKYKAIRAQTVAQSMVNYAVSDLKGMHIIEANLFKIKPLSS